MTTSKIRSILAGVFLLLSGCASTPQYQRSSSSPVVGTAWGQDIHSTVTAVSAERAEAEPIDSIVINYTTRTEPGYDKIYSIRIGELEYAVRDKNFNSLPVTRIFNRSPGQWQYQLQAKMNTQYQLYVRNYSHDTDYEIVATVDGLDVLNGRPGSVRNPGYIVKAGDSLAIKGFRRNNSTQAAFVFSPLNEAYSANSSYGDVRNAGVIGFAAFVLKGKSGKLPLCAANAFPGDGNEFAPAPCQK